MLGRLFLVFSLAVSGLVSTPDPSGAAVPLLRGFQDLEVDEQHGRVFVSQGKAGPVVVTDSAGQHSSTLAGTTGATDLTMSRDGTQLLLAMGRAGVGVLDVATGQIEVTGINDCAESVADVADLIFVFTDCSSRQLIALDPATGEITTLLPVSSELQLETSAAAPDSLLVGHHETSQPVVSRYIVDTSSGVPTLTRAATHQEERGGRFELFDAGSKLVTSAGTVLDAVTLEAAATPYPANRERTADVAVREDGMVALTGGDPATVAIFAPGSRRRLNHLDFTGGPSSRVVANGVAFAGDRMFVVTRDGTYADDVRNLRLRVVVPRAASRLTLTPARTYRCGQNARLNVQLTGPATERSAMAFYRGVRSGDVGIGRISLTANGRGYFTHRLRMRHTIFTAIVLDQGARVEVRRRISLPTACPPR